MTLADDSRTLSMMGEATFWQKGEALYLQFRRHYVPDYLRQMMLMQVNCQRQVYPFGLAGQAAINNPFIGLLGNIGAGIFGGQL